MLSPSEKVITEILNNFKWFCSQVNRLSSLVIGNLISRTTIQHEKRQGKY